MCNGITVLHPKHVVKLHHAADSISIRENGTRQLLAGMCYARN